MVAKDLSKVSFQFEKVLDSLKELLPNRYLVWLPYDEYGGIDDVDPNDNFFKLALIKRADVFGSSRQKQIDFFKWKDEKHTLEQYESYYDKPKPCIKGSDAHELNYPFGQLKNSKSEPIDKYCWINAEPTFFGLKQILTEPDRVFIGDEPNLLKRVKANPTKFIKNLRIKKIAGTSAEDVWFENFSLELNSGLVAIIGNKGSGKSAITDILSLCGNTQQDTANFSFLTGTKFRKTTPYNLSERFEATIEWHDGNTLSKRLDKNPDSSQPQRVKYIPQNFLEKLCADVESNNFEKELKNIIYSHTPHEKRLGKASLDELINYQAALINAEIIQIQTDLKGVNLVILELENKATENYKVLIENKLQLRNEELSAHVAVQPIKPDDTPTSAASQELVKTITGIRATIDELRTVIETQKGKQNDLNVRIAELKRALQFYTTLDVQLKRYQQTPDEFLDILTENKIKPASVFTYTINLAPINESLKAIGQELAEVISSLDAATETSSAGKLKKHLEEIKQLQEELDKPAKLQQKYIDDLKVWELRKKEIEGASNVEDSLKYYENTLEYLTKRLLPELAGRKEERKKLLEKLFERKMDLVNLRKELYEPVTSFIDNFKELKARYNVKLDASMELKSFEDRFFAFVSQGRAGSFSGKEEAYKRVGTIIEKARFDNAAGFVAFADELLDNLKFDRRQNGTVAMDVESQLKKGASVSELYDFIFSAEYLQPVYNLKLGNKSLEELSPGERGALLLIFYLILDNDDIPLIIDQPEENLDNETVYNILVHFIKQVKEKRQIVIVTHNPNLAIVCDADQIVHMQIEKDNKNTVKYVSGAIEDDLINRAVVNVLEGTLPAFNNRDSKYARRRA